MYSDFSKPKPIPMIPGDAVHIVISDVLVPENNTLTMDVKDIYISLFLYDGNLKECNEIGGRTYRLSTVNDWIAMRCRGRQRKFGVFLQISNSSSKAKSDSEIKPPPKSFVGDDQSSGCTSDELPLTQADI